MKDLNTMHGKIYFISNLNSSRSLYQYSSHFWGMSWGVDILPNSVSDLDLHSVPCGQCDLCKHQQESKQEDNGTHRTPEKRIFAKLYHNVY